MPDNPNMEIPDTVRQLAERNVEQARQAYSQFMDAIRKAQDMVAKSSGAMTEATLEIQSRALRFTEENVEAGFRFAAELSRARDMKEYFEIQQRHAQRQMATYAQQAQELGRLMAEAASRVQPKG
jgi:phasin